MKKISGFTLIELIVVIAILALLTTIGVISLKSSQTKGRDARRKSDLRAIQAALELYYADNHRYPLTPNGTSDLGSSGGIWIKDDGSSPSLPLGISYMNPLPKDPRSSSGNPQNSATNFNYAYYSGLSISCTLNGNSSTLTPGQFYILYTNLENPSDPEENQTIPLRDKGGCSGSWAANSVSSKQLFLVTNP